MTSITRTARTATRLGLLAALLALATAACGEIPQAPSGSNPPPGSPAAPGSGAAAAVGQPVRDGDLEFTVTGFECGQTTIGDQYVRQTAQGQYCVLSVTAANVGDQAASYSTENHKLLDGDGRQFTADGAATYALTPDGSLIFTQINPGNRVDARVVFDVPAGVRPVAVELRESPFFGRGVRVRLS